MSLTGNAEGKVLRGTINKLTELRGYSAYEVALLNGFSGTEEEWLDSLRADVFSEEEKKELVKEVAESVTLESIGLDGIEKDVASKVSKSGDTMTGSLNMSGNKVLNVGTPTANTDVANKQYVDNVTDGAKAYTDERITETREYVDTNVNETKSYATTFAKKVSNPRNLLDNSDFRNPVNQRGGTSYSGAKYTLDRWYLWSDGSHTGTATISADGVMLERNDSGRMTFGQRFPLNFLLADHYTLAYCDFNNVVHIESCEVKRDNEGEPTEYDRIEIEVTEDIGIKWAALYEGAYTAETLPDYQPKGYAQELLECLRYYFKPENVPIGSGYCRLGGGVADVLIPAPIKMRTMPTLEYSTLDFNIRYMNGSSGATCVPDEVAVRTFAANGITLTFKQTNLPGNVPVSVYKTTEFAFSADL